MRGGGRGGGQRAGLPTPGRGPELAPHVLHMGHPQDSEASRETAWGTESHRPRPPSPGSVLEASRFREGFPGASGAVGLLNPLIQKRNRKCVWRLISGTRERVREPPVLTRVPFLTLLHPRGSWRRARCSGRAEWCSQSPSLACGASVPPLRALAVTRPYP